MVYRLKLADQVEIECVTLAELMDLIRELTAMGQILSKKDIESVTKNKIVS